MLHTILPTQMQAAEQTAFAAGLSPLLTMETAARAAFDVLLDLLGCDCRGKNVLFLCGPGNNGGDGLVMARLLLQARGFARIILLDTPKTAEAQINLRHLQAMGADIEAVPDELLEDEYDAVVDALFGTGFTGSIAADSPAGRLLTWANTCGPMLSIDVPSGMDAATGAVEGVCARAIWTVTFHRPKPGLYLTERRDCVGEITVAPIGLPREFDPQGGLLVNEEGDLHTLLPDRPASAHKGDCRAHGHLRRQPGHGGRGDDGCPRGAACRRGADDGDLPARCDARFAAGGAQRHVSCGGGSAHAQVRCAADGLRYCRK